MTRNLKFDTWPEIFIQILRVNFFLEKKSKKYDSKNFRDLTGIPVPIPVPAGDSNPGIENRPGSRSRPGADPLHVVPNFPESMYFTRESYNHRRHWHLSDDHRKKIKPKELGTSLHYSLQLTISFYPVYMSRFGGP